MPNARVIVEWITVDFPSGTGVYTLYISNAEGELEPYQTVSGGGIPPPFQVDLSIGVHYYEIIAKDLRTGLYSKAANGYMIVKTDSTKLYTLIAKWNKPHINRGSTQGLDPAVPPKWATAKSDWEAFQEVAKAIVGTVTNMGATMESDNYNSVTRKYNDILVATPSNPFEIIDKYPIGAAVHMEVRNYGTDNVQVGGVQVIDFIAGQSETPGPAIPSWPYGLDISAIEYDTTGPYVTISTSAPNGGPRSYDFGNDIKLNNVMEGGVSFIILHDGSVFDFFKNLQPGTQVPYNQIYLDEFIIGYSLTPPLTKVP